MINTMHTRLFEPSDLINSQTSDFKRKQTAQKLPRKVIFKGVRSTAEYQHVTKDANFSAQESLDERRRYVLSPHCLFREETFHASDKHDSWNSKTRFAYCCHGYHVSDNMLLRPISHIHILSVARFHIFFHIIYTEGFHWCYLCSALHSLF